MTRERFTRERNLFLFCSLGVAVAAFAVVLTLARANDSYFEGASSAVARGVVLLDWTVKLIFLYLTFRFARFLRLPWWAIVILCILAPLGLFFIIPFASLLISAWLTGRSVGSAQYESGVRQPLEQPSAPHGTTAPDRTGVIDWPSGSTPTLPAASAEVSEPQLPARTTADVSSAEPAPEPVLTQDSRTSDLIITPDFERALRLINKLEPCVFITGKAGTGKSSLLRLLRDQSQRKSVFLAPTGLAAVNIEGQTIHSFFRFPPRTLTKDDIKVVRNAELFEALETIVIDEVSMVRADMIDAIDYFLRLNRSNFDAPFGGVQMVFFGDLHQLPPIVKEKSEADYLNDNYTSPFFFDAHVFDGCPLRLLELRRIFRQTDPVFLDALAGVRGNNVTDQHMQLINSRFSTTPLASTDSTSITLTPDNNLAAQINRERLSRLPPPEFRHEGIIEGEFDEKSYPTDYCLRLRVGAAVMLVKNDAQRRWVNGTLGKVVALTESSVTVEIQSDSEDLPYAYPVEPETWEAIKYRYDRSTRTIAPEVVGSFQQYPLKLAWAITVHKSQGMTFDNMVLDMGRGAFAHGQTYVALSRCRSLEGITLRRPLRRSDIRLDQRIERLPSRCLPDCE